MNIFTTLVSTLSITITLLYGISLLSSLINNIYFMYSANDLQSSVVAYIYTPQIYGDVKIEWFHSTFRAYILPPKLQNILSSITF